MSGSLWYVMRETESDRRSPIAPRQVAKPAAGERKSVTSGTRFVSAFQNRSRVMATC
jgi:hypothetical protein